MPGARCSAISTTFATRPTVLSYDGWAVLVSFVAKIIINVLIWFCAILIAPLGVLYLWFRTRG